MLLGKDFVPTAPVEIHLDSVTNKVIATVPSSAQQGHSSMTSTFAVPVSIPATTTAGSHILVATQNAHQMNGGNPARALIYVGANPVGAQSGAAGRPVGLIVGPQLGTADLALISLGVAVGGLLVAGSLSLFARRRHGLVKPE
ncbi:MAG: hypothetical protein ACRDWV_04965 [Acidimicrobiales bacterium]